MKRSRGNLVTKEMSEATFRSFKASKDAVWPSLEFARTMGYIVPSPPLMYAFSHRVFCHQGQVFNGHGMSCVGTPVVTAQVRDLPRMGIPLPNSDYKTYTYNEI